MSNVVQQGQNRKGSTSGKDFTHTVFDDDDDDDFDDTGNGDNSKRFRYYFTCTLSRN